jgi:predicted DNA binding protein
MLKVFVYTDDIKEQTGPLQYISESKFGRKNDFLWTNVENGKWKTHGYLDAQATSKIPEKDILTATGESGTIIFADTNGIHRGGYVKEGIRMKTHALYLRPDAEHIVSGPLQTFNYNKDTLNYCDYNSLEFNQLTDRQKACLT